MSLVNSKRYKSFFFKTLIFSVIGWICLQLSVYLLCRPSEWYWIYDTIKMKESIALHIPGNKIVFVGGSATLFGVRTEDIEKELKIPSVNYGVHAALEIDYILERAKRFLKPGDVIILSLEYNHFLYDGNLNEVRARFVLLFDKTHYNTLSFLNKINYFLKFSPITVELSFQDLYLKILGKKKVLKYDVKTLNKNGDETNNVGNDIIKKKFDNIQPIPVQKGEFKETVGLKILTNFNKWCMENNINFFVTYAPTILFDIYLDKEYQEYFNKLQVFFIEQNIKTLGFPNDFFYNSDLFHDTEYHLNSKGMTCHTKRLLAKIKEAMPYKLTNIKPQLPDRSRLP